MPLLLADIKSAPDQMGDFTCTVREIVNFDVVKSKFSKKEEQKVDLILSDASDTQTISIFGAPFIPEVGEVVRLRIKVKKDGNAEYYNGSKLRRIYTDSPKLNPAESTQIEVLKRIAAAIEAMRSSSNITDENPIDVIPKEEAKKIVFELLGLPEAEPIKGKIIEIARKIIAYPNVESKK